jgi:hypothetical protein
VALAEQRSALESSYRNSVYCCHVLQQEAGKVRGKWCGNRWCFQCSRVRTARAIERYTPALATWDKWLVTLTVPNAPAAHLAATLRLMLGCLTKVKRAVKRTDRLALRALRKLECTHNVRRDDYHPHLHLVVDGEPAARALVAGWLAAWPGTVPEAQDARRCDDASLIEVFKYFTKLTTGKKLMPPAALDVIFTAMRGLRVYQPMGFTVPARDSSQDENAAVDDGPGTAAPDPDREPTSWEWEQRAADWIDHATGELLSGYEPAPRFRTFVESINPRDSQSYPTQNPPDQCLTLEKQPLKMSAKSPVSGPGGELRRGPRRDASARRDDFRVAPGTRGDLPAPRAYGAGLDPHGPA